jgi:hypothetical protein
MLFEKTRAAQTSRMRQRTPTGDLIESISHHMVWMKYKKKVPIKEAIARAGDE